MASAPAPNAPSVLTTVRSPHAATCSSVKRSVGVCAKMSTPEPMARSFSAKRFATRLTGRSARLKTLLLDQSFIAGVGNIYADEALWRARLHPLRAADTLTTIEVRRLHRAVRAVLRQAIANRVSSFADYVGADGEPGDNAEHLAVYQRTGQRCLRCGREVARIVVGQRSTHFCPRCQALPEPRRST